MNPSQSAGSVSTRVARSSMPMVVARPALPGVVHEDVDRAAVGDRADDRVVVGHVEHRGTGRRHRRPRSRRRPPRRVRARGRSRAPRRPRRPACVAISRPTPWPAPVTRARCPERSISYVMRVAPVGGQTAPSAWSAAISSAVNPAARERVVGVRAERRRRLGGERCPRSRRASRSRTGERTTRACRHRRRRARRSNPAPARAGRRAGRRS